MSDNLTSGDPGRALFKFSIPLFISVIFQQLYSIADSAIVGIFSGESALSAVGASYPVTMIFMAVAIGVSVGCTVVISRFYGAGSNDKVKTASYTTIISSLVLALIMTAVGLLAGKELLRLLKTPEEIMPDGVLYLNIFTGGLTFLFLYNVITGIFTALGDSKTPLRFLIISSVSNVILDYVMVALWKMGVGGAAWATFIAQGASCILAGITLFVRLSRLESKVRPAVFSFKMLKKISVIAVPSVLQQSFVSVGNIFIQGLVNACGAPVIAGYSAAIKLNTFAITSFSALANGISTFTSQNLGAGRADRVKKGFSRGALMSLSVAAPFFAVYFFLGEHLITAFIKDASDMAVLSGTEFLKICAPFYFVICLKLMADGVLRGAGSIVYFMVTTFSDLVLRVALAFLLAPSMGYRGIWSSWPVGWSLAAVLSLSFYFFGVWNPEKKKKLKS